MGSRTWNAYHSHNETHDEWEGEFSTLVLCEDMSRRKRLLDPSLPLSNVLVQDEQDERAKTTTQ